MLTPDEKLFDQRNYLDNISLIKREQIQIKKTFSNSFLIKLDTLLEKCFLKPKDKKEFFITKEKLILEFLYLLQEQKKFKNSDLIHNQLITLAVFDFETNLVGKILNINLKNKTIEFLTLDSIKNKKLPEIKSFEKLDLFDAFSLKMRSYYEKQKQFYDCYNYKESFDLLTGKEIQQKKDDTIHYSLGRGIPLDKKVQERINNRDLPDKAA